MKNNLISSALALVILFGSGCVINTSSKDYYVDLPAEGKTFDVKSFKALQVDGVFNVVLSQGTKESVVVKGALPKTLKVAVEEGTLIITDTSKGINLSHRSVKTTIYVTLVDINTMEISTVGETTSSDTLKLKNLKVTCEGVGSTTLWVNGDTIKVSEDGVGKLTVAGKAVYSELDDSSVGALDAKKFNAKVLHADVSGVGAAKVFASREIYLDVSGVSGVEYNGPAKELQKNESSGIGKSRTRRLELQ